MANPTKHIIIIDDEDQEEQKEFLVQKLKQNFDIHVHTIWTLDRAITPDKLIIRENLKTVIMDVMKGKNIDLVLTDYQLADDETNGLDVVEIVKDIRASVPVMVYSGDLERVIGDLLGDNFQDKSKEEIIPVINKLMKLGVEKFSGRTKYDQDVMMFLNKKKTLDLDELLAQKLRELGDERFEAGTPDFRDKNLNDIADMIGNKGNARYSLWIDDLFEQTATYISRCNKDE